MLSWSWTFQKIEGELGDSEIKGWGQVWFGERQRWNRERVFYFVGDIYLLKGETKLKDRFLGYLLIDYIEYELFEFEYDEMR